LSQQTNARFEPTNDVRRAICRPVVDDQDFTIAGRNVLLQNANKSLLDIAFLIICVDEDRQDWLRHRTAPPLPKWHEANVRFSGRPAFCDSLWTNSNPLLVMNSIT